MFYFGGQAWKKAVYTSPAEGEKRYDGNQRRLWGRYWKVRGSIRSLSYFIGQLKASLTRDQFEAKELKKELLKLGAVESEFYEP